MVLISSNTKMELFLLLLQIPVLIFIIKYIRKQHSDSLFVNSYYYLLSFKVTAGLILGIIYFKYYGYGDTNSYYHDLELAKNVLYSSWEKYFKLIFLGDIPDEIKLSSANYRDDRAYSFIRIVSPFYILLGSNYWICSIYLSLFSFFGLWILTNTIIKFYKVNSLALLISFFIFPSVVFWSSGLIKESFIIGAMCIQISIALSMANLLTKRWVLKFSVLLILSLAVLKIKFYYFAVLFAVLVPYSLVKYFSEKIPFLKNNKSYRISVFFLLLIMMTLLASFYHPVLHLDYLSNALYLNYSTTLKFSNSYNTYIFEGLNASPSSFITHIPKALVYGLFGPLLWQCNNLITAINGTENMILIFLFITFLLTNLKKEKLIKIDIEEISLVIYIVTLAMFMAFASPNWGSLVRYKIGYLPFFLLLILNNNIIISQLERRFSFLKL